MNTPQDFSDWLRPLVRTVMQEVLAATGQGTVPKLYDVDQAAQILSIPKRWLYERTASGAIPHQKIGKYVRFSDADLNQIIERASGKEPKG